MLHGKRVIALCITKLHTPLGTEFTHRLAALAQKMDCKLLVLNTFVDFFSNDEQDEGSASVFRLANAPLVDAVIVLADGFHNQTVVEQIRQRALQRQQPVVLVRGRADGCWSVLPDYHDAFCRVMTHVIREHGARDVHFIAGKMGDEASELRIACFRDALAQNGIPFSENMLSYGDYWNDPAREVVRRLQLENRHMPRAIFCANDSMAFGVCTELALLGYRVPGDVIVTGFDGVPAIDSFSPRLTTCWEDLGAMASVSFRAALAGIAGQEPQVFTYPHLPRFSESCGCAAPAAMDDRAAFRLHDTLDSMQGHEDFIYTCIGHMQSISDMRKLHEALSICMLGNSYVSLNSSFVADALEVTQEAEHPFSQQLMVIPARYTPAGEEAPVQMALEDVVPTPEKWLASDDVAVITPIHVGSLVCGYYTAFTRDLPGSANRLKRVSAAINIALSAAVNHFRQANMNKRIQQAAVTNAVTGLPNLKGAVEWFEIFAAKKQNHYQTVAVSIYALPKYAYIMENYGVEAVDEALRFTAEALRIANPSRCYIAHVAEDSFAVINHYTDDSEVGESIDRATSVFFGQIEGFNTRSARAYYVEVNCGCTVLNSGWQGTLESYLRKANSEMFSNRIRYGMGVAEKCGNEPHTHYAAFRKLIEENLFHYHFQPIVCARTGSVFAYEALMRTDPRIGMSPPQVLEAARQYSRLYDVEKFTLFNILERIANERERFGDRSIFINTIPGHFLHPEDVERLSALYGDCLNRVVFELTEENTVTDEELKTIRQLCEQGCGSMIALDDYGVGHSNIVNLMRYRPQIIKIDHYLISGVHADSNRQMFVRSTIEFARSNGAIVLAEGVETAEEMRTVIEMGVDLIQGFYTGRPVHDPVAAIPEEIRQEILAINAELNR